MLPVSPTDRLFILAGAGVSAESGIPTFRGVGGLWRNYRIEEVASPEAWHRRSPAGVGVLFDASACSRLRKPPNVPQHHAV
jgi:NAD-dependent SIR2 family protein deacetylase